MSGCLHTIFRLERIRGNEKERDGAREKERVREGGLKRVSERKK